MGKVNDTDIVRSTSVLFQFPLFRNLLWYAKIHLVCSRSSVTLILTLPGAGGSIPFNLVSDGRAVLRCGSYGGIPGTPKCPHVTADATSSENDSQHKWCHL